jgi:hypothetical protein
MYMGMRLAKKLAVILVQQHSNFLNIFHRLQESAPDKLRTILRQPVASS